MQASDLMPRLGSYTQLSSGFFEHHPPAAYYNGAGFRGGGRAQGSTSLVNYPN